jgi:signal transduction histidine kinase
MVIAQEEGIFTTGDFRELLQTDNLDCLLVLTRQEDVLIEVIRNKRPDISIVDFQTYSLFMSFFRMDLKRFRHAEKQIAMEKMVSDSLMKFTNEPILILNTDFTIFQANEAFLQTTGADRSDLQGSYCYQTIYGYQVHCSSASPKHECPVLETLRTGKTAHAIHEWTAVDKGSADCNVISYPVKNQNGEIVKVLEIWQDITDQFQSTWEKRSRRLKDDLKKLVHEDRMISLGKLAASCVHEINNPIQGLITFCRLMEDTLGQGRVGKSDIEDMKNYSSLMSGELERCGRIVTSLLSFARENNESYSDIVFQDVISSVTALTQHKMSLQNIELITEISSQAFIIRADKHQLQQCLMNLVFNAMEAMPDGGRLRIALTGDKTGRNTVLVIEDNGTGISEEMISNIFDPFFTTKEAGHGTGLGLPIVYGVIKSLNASIDVKSEVGKGTIFRLEFPLSTPFAEPAGGES